MTLEEAIGTARSQSVAALQAKHAFVSTYWAYRSYQASRLPSLNLYGNLMNFDRSLTLLQSYEDGTFRYANSYNLQNSLGLSVERAAVRRDYLQTKGTHSVTFLAFSTASSIVPT